MGHPDPDSACVEYYEALSLAKNAWEMSKDMDELAPPVEQYGSDPAIIIEKQITEDRRSIKGLQVFAATLRELEIAHLPVPPSFRLPEPDIQRLARLGSEAVSELFNRPAHKQFGSVF